MAALRGPGGTWTTELTGVTAGQAASWTVNLLNANTDAVVTAGTPGLGVSETDPASGNYKRTFTLPTTAGVYKAEWVNGSLKYIDDEFVEVTYSSSQTAQPTGSDLCTLQDVRAEGEMPIPDTTRDSLIQQLITAASAAIMNEVDREFAPTSSGTRRFRVDDYGLNLAPYDLRAVTTMTLHPESSSPITLTRSTDYELTPANSASGTYQSIRFSAYRYDLLVSDHAYRFGFSQLDINGDWGFPSVPTIVNRACVLTVLAWIRRDVSALGFSNDFDTSQPQSPTTFGLPYEARRLLQPYYRMRAYAF